MEFVGQLRLRFEDLRRAQISDNMDLVLNTISTEGCSSCKLYIGKELIEFYELMNKEIEDRWSKASGYVLGKLLIEY